MNEISTSAVSWQISGNGNYIAVLPDNSKINCGKRIIGSIIRYTELKPEAMLGLKKEFHKFEGFGELPKLPEFASFAL